MDSENKSRLQVVHIVEATGGGVAKHIHDLLDGLTRLGVDNHLLFGSHRADGIFERALAHFSSTTVTAKGIDNLIRSISLKDFSALRQIVKYIRALDGNVLIHGHSSKAGALARIAGLLSSTPTIYTPHAFITLSPNLKRAERFIYTALERILSRMRSHVIAVSEEEHKEAIRLGNSPSRTHLIPNGINLPQLSSAERHEIRSKNRLRWNLPDDAVAVGFVGRFSPQKGVHDLLSAFATMSQQGAPGNPHLVLVGRGPSKSELARLSDQLGITSLIKWDETNDGFNAMLGFDVFVLPSHYEGFPYVLLEAMSAGLPIVSTRVGGTELALSDGVNAMMVPPRDPKQLSEALVALLNDRQRMIEFGAQSSERVGYFSADTMVSDTLALYESLF